MMNNYSQDAVEIGVNVSRSTLSKIENGVGKIDLDRLERFAKFFKVDVKTIIALPANAAEYQKKVESTSVEEVVVDYRKADVELARCQEKMTSLKKEMSYLKQEIVQNKSQLKDKDMIIQLLSQQAQ